MGHGESLSLEKFEIKQQVLKKLTERHEIYCELKGRAEGIVHPLALLAKELTKGEESFQSEECLTRRSGLLSFLQEANDCQKSLLRFMGEISPLNFAPMYCLDLFWKLLLIRFELLI